MNVCNFKLVGLHMFTRSRAAHTYRPNIKISLPKAGDIGDSEVVLNVLLGEGGSATY